MVKVTKIRKLRAIKWYVSRDYKANDIQKRLSKRGLGVRRKVLLAEIRKIKKIKITPEKRRKHIPKKYRKKVFPPPRPLEEIYRTAYIISDVPVHSRPFRRNYLGFRLLAFSYNADYLRRKSDYLRKLLVMLTNEYLKSDITNWFGYDFYIGREYPILIYVYRSELFNNKWQFRVEREGQEIYSRSGYL